MPSKVGECVCESKFQDKVYGSRKRLHTQKVKPAGTKVCTCTVCGRTREVQ